jgi:hypothetical protein
MHTDRNMEMPAEGRLKSICFVSNFIPCVRIPFFIIISFDVEHLKSVSSIAVRYLTIPAQEQMRLPVTKRIALIKGEEEC